jgi:hypothetical protein
MAFARVRFARPPDRIEVFLQLPDVEVNQAA